MDIDFWVERWDNGNLGFHQQTVNPYLAYFYGEKGPTVEQRDKLKVFVPLSGKSKDMLWLSQNAYKVFAVECSDKAVIDFFQENALNYKHASKGAHGLYQSSDLAAPVEIYQGDFFALQAGVLDEVTDVFDRASLIALPPEMRRDYVKKMAELQNPGTRTLLVTLSYDQSEMAGPPFSVSEQEVEDLYCENFDVQKLLFKDILEDEARFKAKGLTALTETVYKLTRK